MDEIFGFVGDFFKFLISFAIIVVMCSALIWMVNAIFNTDSPDSLDADQEFRARCLSIGGTRSKANCYKDGDIVFSKEQE